MVQITVHVSCQLVEPRVRLDGAGQKVAESAVQRAVPGDVTFLPAGEDAARGRGVGDLGANPEHGVDVLADLDVALADELLAAHGVGVVRLVHEDHQVLVGVRDGEAEDVVVNDVLARVDLRQMF